MKAAILATIILSTACGEQPAYCDGHTDTRKAGSWVATHVELDGDCGPIPDAALAYPDGMPQGHVRYQAWLQGQCAYEGSHTHLVEECVPIEPPPPPDERQCRGAYTDGYQQEAHVISAQRARVVGELSLTRHTGASPEVGEVLCSSTYEVTLSRVE